MRELECYYETHVECSMRGTLTIYICSLHRSLRSRAVTSLSVVSVRLCNFASPARLHNDANIDLGFSHVSLNVMLPR